MGAAFFATGQAIIDAIAVRLIGNDENAGVGEGRSGQKQCETESRESGFHNSPK